MGKTKHAEKRLLEELGKAPKSKKELKRIIIKAKGDHHTSGRQMKKHHLKKTLRKLEERGQIRKKEKIYELVGSLSSSSSKREKDDDDDDDDDSDADAETTTSPLLPIAVQLRKQAAAQAEKKSVRFGEPEVDLDDEIRRLEMELEQSSSGSSADDDDGDEDEDEDDEPAVLSLSQFANDRIEHLPGSALPEPGKYDPLQRPRKKKNSKESKNAMREVQKKTDGLREAVQEVLAGYKPRSSEKLPFYCRFCAKQYNSEDEFLEHKQTEFHQTAVAMEKKATYCRLCQKQLTSPPQMREHLASRPHKERLHTVQTRQRSEQGQRGKKNPQDRSTRQWG
jgi:hypothetical protein